MKKTFTIGLISFLCVVFITSSAFAGSKRRHRLEGAAIGIGAVLLGKAIIDTAAAHHAGEVIHHRTVIYHEPPPPRRQPRGHWEIKQVWVPPVYKKIWKPGHYNRRGYWMDGRWASRIKKYGYWKEAEVWVARDGHKRHHRQQVRHRRH